ncbi:unnamed protein product [Sphagnum tenellum]
MRPLADIVYAACCNPEKLLFEHPTVDGRRKMGAHYKSLVREARRFYVDDEVTAAATTLGVQHPDVLMAMLQRARSPFRTCWLEWSNRIQCEEAGIPFLDDSPERIGVLVERLDEFEPLYRLTTIVTPINVPANRIGISPITVTYNLNAAIGAEFTSDRDLLVELTNLPIDYIRKTVVGGAYTGRVVDGQAERDPEEIAFREERCNALAMHACITIASHMKLIAQDSLNPDTIYNRGNVSGMFRNEIVENSGTWRMAITLFALINAQDYTAKTQFKKGKNHLAGGKVVPYLDHYMVSLKLPRKVVQDRIVREMIEAIPRRRHEVMGHFRRQPQTEAQLMCDHAYVNETPARQICAIPGCGHRRTWINEYMRGDATVGVVLKDRLVTKN